MGTGHCETLAAAAAVGEAGAAWDVQSWHKCSRSRSRRPRPVTSNVGSTRMCPAGWSRACAGCRKPRRWQPASQPSQNLVVPSQCLHPLLRESPSNMKYNRKAVEFSHRLWHLAEPWSEEASADDVIEQLRTTRTSKDILFTRNFRLQGFLDNKYVVCRPEDKLLFLSKLPPERRHCTGQSRRLAHRARFAARQEDGLPALRQRWLLQRRRQRPRAHWCAKTCPAERGGAGGPAGEHQAHLGRPPVPHHHLLLRFLQHEAAAEHGGGLPGQEAACHGLWQLLYKTEECVFQEVKIPTASSRHISHPLGSWCPGGGRGRQRSSGDESLVGTLWAGVRHQVPSGQLRAALLLWRHIHQVLGPGQLHQHCAVPGPRLPRVGPGHQPAQPVLRQRVPRPHGPPLVIWSDLPSANLCWTPGGHGLRQVPPQFKLLSHRLDRQDGAAVEHPAGELGEALNRPLRPRALPGLFLQR